MNKTKKDFFMFLNKMYSNQYPEYIYSIWYSSCLPGSLHEVLDFDCWQVLYHAFYQTDETNFIK